MKQLIFQAAALTTTNLLFCQSSQALVSPISFFWKTRAFQQKLLNPSSSLSSLSFTPPILVEVQVQSSLMSTSKADEIPSDDSILGNCKMMNNPSTEKQLEEKKIVPVPHDPLQVLPVAVITTSTNSSKDTSTSKPDIPVYSKMHSMTICMVPQPKYKKAWEEITKARTELKDPGLFRWPPHVNILYPFIDILHPKLLPVKHPVASDSNHDDSDNNDLSKKDRSLDMIVDQTLTLLQGAIEKCDPFSVALESMGTFGGKKRGVLYLIPRSFRQEEEEEEEEEKTSTLSSLAVASSTSTQDQIDGTTKSDGDGEKVEKLIESEVVEPLVELQSILETTFPQCNDQKKHSKYTPHMTISHFISLEDALEAKTKIEQWWSKDSIIEFDVSEVYILKRAGDGGQFKILATLPLGSANSQIQIHDPPLAFPDMPSVEEDWVHEERMKLKERRNGNGTGNRRRRSGRKKKERIDIGRNRIVDTPEEIAKKRAERAAKRERLAREVAALEQAIKSE